MRDGASVWVARGSEWAHVDLGPANVDVVYGRRLTWHANDEELTRLIRSEIVDRWASLGVPYAGQDIRASAVAMPARYFPANAVRDPNADGPPFIDYVQPGIGYHLVGQAGFGVCAWDRRTAGACMNSDADRSVMVGELVQHVWAAAVMFHPPLYGLHAAAVVGPDGGATLLVGDSRVGKSSLAAYLALRHGFGYLTDDLTMLDGRSLVAYGRPWRLELRSGGLEVLWPGAPPPGVALGDKRVLDARALLPVVASARVSAIVFVRRGDQSLTELDSETTLSRLEKPVSVFMDCPDVIQGHAAVFSDLACGARGLEMTVDHGLGVAHAAAALVGALTA